MYKLPGMKKVFRDKALLFGAGPKFHSFVSQRRQSSEWEDDIVCRYVESTHLCFCRPTQARCWFLTKHDKLDLKCTLAPLLHICFSFAIYLFTYFFIKFIGGETGS